MKFMMRNAAIKNGGRSFCQARFPANGLTRTGLKKNSNHFALFAAVAWPGKLNTQTTRQEQREMPNEKQSI